MGKLEISQSRNDFLDAMRKEFGPEDCVYSESKTTPLFGAVRFKDDEFRIGFRRRWLVAAFAPPFLVRVNETHPRVSLSISFAPQRSFVFSYGLIYGFLGLAFLGNPNVGNWMRFCLVIVFAVLAAWCYFRIKRESKAIETFLSGMGEGGPKQQA